MQLVAALAVDVLRGALGMEHQVRARHPVAFVQLSQALLVASPPALQLQRETAPRRFGAALCVALSRCVLCVAPPSCSAAEGAPQTGPCLRAVPLLGPVFRGASRDGARARSSSGMPWQHLTVQLTRESEDAAGDPDLYGMFYGGAAGAVRPPARLALRPRTRVDPCLT